MMFMGTEPSKQDPRAIPGISVGSELAAASDSGIDLRAETSERKRVFRDNFRRELHRSGLSIEELSHKAAIDLPTLRRWRREGVAQPKHEHIEGLAQVFGLADPWSLMSGGAEHVRSPLDRATNPMIQLICEESPELFDDFTTEDWDELYSSHGTGGALSREGVTLAAQRINQKREIRRKFEAVLETHHFRTLAALIDVLYRDTTVR